MDYAKESLRLHGEWKGKIEVVTRVPVENKDDLSLAYTGGRNGSPKTFFSKNKTVCFFEVTCS